jgi:hypothetical protein
LKPKFPLLTPQKDVDLGPTVVEVAR